jgi:hypothetical protein
MKLSKLKPSPLLIVLAVILLAISGYWGWTKYRNFSMTKQFEAVRQSIQIPNEVHLTDKSFTAYSQQGLPHYAPFALFSYTYDRAKQQEVHTAILNELKTDGYTITGNDASSAERHINFDWYVYGKNSTNKSEVRFEASGNNITQKICRVNDCY